MKTVRVQGVDLKVLDRGQGPALLFVHAFPIDHSMWSAQCDFFAARRRVIAPDLRGFGASQATPGSVSMEQFADDLAGLLEALHVEGPVVFCGLSMGGYIGWQFCRKFADRLRALVLCDTRALPDTAEGRDGRLKMVDHLLRAGTPFLSDAMLPRMFAPDTLARLPGAVDFVRQKILAGAPEGLAAALRGMADRPDMSDFLPTIRVPTLLVVGQHDVISPVDEMRRMAAAIPDAQLEVIPGAGHLPALENPERFNDVLDRFLDWLGE